MYSGYQFWLFVKIGSDEEGERTRLGVQAAYNLARAFHHLGLSHLAMPYYEEVLFHT